MLTTAGCGVVCAHAVLQCAGGSFAFADWPTYAPLGQNVYVNGTCQPGFQPTDPSQPPRRLCPSAGTYTATLINPCIRKSLAALARPSPRAVLTPPIRTGNFANAIRDQLLGRRQLWQRQLAADAVWQHRGRHLPHGLRARCAAPRLPAGRHLVGDHRQPLPAYAKSRNTCGRVPMPASRNAEPWPPF